MKPVAWLLAALLAACSREQDDACASLADTAAGAALGDAVDAYNLGVEFYKGKCVGKNYASAATMWEKAAAGGVVSAKNNLGYLLSEGLGRRKDDARAVALWREAAQAGHAESQVHLGNAIFHGYGVPKDEATGLAWVLRAIDSATRHPEIGGGPAVLEAARDEKSRMLAAAPTLLQTAADRAADLQIDPQAP